MAKNWTLREAVGVITTGTDKEAVQELAKRFPLAAMAIAKMGSNEGIETLFGNMPEHMTMLKMERALKGGVEAADDEEDDADQEAGSADGGAEDLEAMTIKELHALCIKKGIKVSKYGKPKSYYIDQLSGANSGSSSETEEAEDGQPSYGDMSAVELYKLCKKRGLKVEPKKKSAEYIKVLEADDAAANDDAGDDWEDDEEDVKDKKSNQKSSKQAKKKQDDDDDEDWEI